jgi:hypothetical protein
MLSGHTQLALRRRSREGELEPERLAVALETIIGSNRRDQRQLSRSDFDARREDPARRCLASDPFVSAESQTG